MRLMVVDDSTDAQRLLQSLLNAAGYEEIVIAESFAVAFDHLSCPTAGSGMSPIDLILLDIGLPMVDGIEACRHFKADQRLRDIPIIMVTATADARVLADAFAAGAVDYITKPFRPLELLARVRSVLDLKQAVEARRAREHELIAKNQELQRALAEIQTLRGLIKICSFCKKIQNDEGNWQQVELYIRDHTEAEFSHGVCADCTRRHYPGLLKG
jgi:phosphoserine phosphatase RsbU/P